MSPRLGHPCTMSHKTIYKTFVRVLSCDFSWGDNKALSIHFKHGPNQQTHRKDFVQEFISGPFKCNHSTKKFSQAGVSYKCPNHSIDKSQRKNAGMSSQQRLKSPALPVYFCLLCSLRAGIGLISLLRLESLIIPISCPSFYARKC